MAQQGYGTGKGTAKETGSTPSDEKSFVDKAWDVQHRLESRTKRIGSGRYARVLRMARKPEPEEFRRTAIIVAIGLIVIGAIGFSILLLMEGLHSLLDIR